MPHIGIHRLAPGHSQERGAKDGETDVEILVDQEVDGIKRAQRGQHGRRLHDAVDAEQSEDGEPYEHHRSKYLPDNPGTVFLHDEHADQNDDSDGYDGWRQRRRIHLQSLDRAQHGDGGRDGAVAIEQRRADKADDQQFRPPRPGLGVPRRQ